MEPHSESFGEGIKQENHLFESIHPLLKRSGIHIETTTVPRRKGCNRGYWFMLSWDSDAPKDPEDICKRLSGFKVNSRPIYLCEGNDTSTASDRSESHTSTASESTAGDLSADEQITMMIDMILTTFPSAYRTWSLSERRG